MNTDTSDTCPPKHRDPALYQDPVLPQVSPEEMEELLHTINGTPNTEHEQTFFTLPESYRYRGEGMPHLPPTQTGDGYGLFFIRPPGGRLLKCIADDGSLDGWQHVSVSVVDQPTKCPSWLEMDAIKNLFWTEDAAVMSSTRPGRTG